MNIAARIGMWGEEIDAGNLFIYPKNRVYDGLKRPADSVSEICFAKGSAWFGIADNGYWQNLGELTYIEKNKFNVAPKNQWYGIGSPIKIKPESKYLFSATFDVEPVRIGAAYYGQSDNGYIYIGNKHDSTKKEDRIELVLPPKANAEYIVLIFLGTTDNQPVTYSDVRFEEIV